MEISDYQQQWQVAGLPNVGIYFRWKPPHPIIIAVIIIQSVCKARQYMYT